MNDSKTIGILAFQGDVVEHARMIAKLGYRSLPVRMVEDLAKVDALIIPGGESTTIGFFLKETGVGEAIKKRALDPKRPMPVWGTCAGAIVLARDIESHIIPHHLGLVDMAIARNGYGRQIDSFTTAIDIPKLGMENLQAAFIRAPIITKVGKRAEVLATQDGNICMVRQGNLVASTFHPELTLDPRLHRWFLTLI